MKKLVLDTYADEFGLLDEKNSLIKFYDKGKCWDSAFYKKEDGRYIVLSKHKIKLIKDLDVYNKNLKKKKGK